MAASTDDAASPSAPRRSPAQARILDAAIKLFAQHGVGGTSLQMIADEIGVTKAAVYHQFNTKEAIIMAAADGPLRQIEAALDAAETADPPARGIEAYLRQMIELAIDRRAEYRSLITDPMIVRLVQGHERIRRLRERESRVLTGSDASPAALVRGAMVSTALIGATAHPLVADVDDDTLREQLFELACRFLELPRSSEQRATVGEPCGAEP